MSEGTLTARTEFEDGRVSCALALDDPEAPPTWIKIFNNMASAQRFAEVYNVEFIDLCTPMPDGM